VETPQVAGMGRESTMGLIDRLVSAALPLTPKPIVRYVAGRYIAGDSVDDAMRTVQRLNDEGALGTVDALGEFVKSREIARFETDRSLLVIEQIRSRGVRSGLSVKLTSLGLDIDRQFCRDNLLEILRLAEQLGVFVRIDMENSPYTDATLELGAEMWEKFPGRVGVVLQAYMRRTLDDVRRHAPSGISFRLCKGIYAEPSDIAFQERGEVQENYLAAMRLMFEHGSFVGLATHDDYLIESAKGYITAQGISDTGYEFQMLLGVRESRRRDLIAAGHRLRVYVPFGEDWYGYSVRRLRENPAIAGHVFRSFFRRGG